MSTGVTTVSDRMVDRGPHVIVGCFSRGGSSLVWNLLASHPALSSPGMETHELFVGRNADRSGVSKWGVHAGHMLRGAGLPRPGRRGGRFFLDAGLFEPSNLARRRIPRNLRAAVRSRILDAPVEVTPRIDPVLAETGPGSGDIAGGRGVVLKSINGIVFLTPSLRRILDPCRTVILLRDGVAMCESRMRRGTFRDAARFGLVFSAVVAEMRRQIEAEPGTVVVFFEDLLRDPVGFTHDLHRRVGLEPRTVDRVRVKNKPHLGDHARSQRTREPGHVWIPIRELRTFVSPSIDDTQRSRLSSADRRAFESHARDAMGWISDMRATGR